jgi:hypothetical protein
VPLHWRPSRSSRGRGSKEHSPCPSSIVGIAVMLTDLVAALQPFGFDRTGLDPAV